MTGKEIRMIREALGFNVQQWAARHNVTYDTVRKWESGKNPLTGMALFVYKRYLRKLNKESALKHKKKLVITKQ